MTGFGKGRRSSPAAQTVKVDPKRTSAMGFRSIISGIIDTHSRLDFHRAGVLLSASVIFRDGGWIDLPSGECRLKQAGVNAAWVDLGEEGIRGNGHMTMLEKISDAVAARVENWVDKALPERTASR
jgi:hypothetical protein